MRGAVRPSKRRAKRHRHLSLSARDSEWAVVSRNAARLGLSKARYLVGLVERDAAEEEDRGPFMALSPEEQRALLEAVRAIHALLLEDAPGEEAPARETAATAPAEEPGPSAPEPDPPAAAGEGAPDAPAPEPPAPAGESGTPDAPEPDDPAPAQPRLL
ncbi:MAG: hypothetical protein OXC28_06960 [Defluviicoccus sp.]|nr:hypothetical protein [Defluviicoccus sp.]